MKVESPSVQLLHQHLDRGHTTPPYQHQQRLQVRSETTPPQPKPKTRIKKYFDLTKIQKDSCYICIRPTFKLNKLN